MKNVFEDYYLHQAGTGLPVFVGARSQRGHGLLGGLARMMIPLIKRGGRSLLKHGVQTGAEILGDVLSGQNLKTAAQRRVKQRGQRLLQQASQTLTGAGNGRKRKTPPAPPGAPARKRIKQGGGKSSRQFPGRGRTRQTSDIFS